MSAPRRSRTVLQCAECDTEVTVLDTEDLEEVEIRWDADHASCGKPPIEAEWNRLVKQGDAATLIAHGGDASTVIPFPRPSWSVRYRDVVGDSVLGSYYRSERVAVASTNSVGWTVDDEYLAARILVAAKMFGNGVRTVGLTMEKKNLANPAGMSLTIAEARQLAEVLNAAADMAETS